MRTAHGDLAPAVIQLTRCGFSSAFEIPAYAARLAESLSCHHSPLHARGGLSAGSPVELQHSFRSIRMFEKLILESSCFRVVLSVRGYNESRRKEEEVQHQVSF